MSKKYYTPDWHDLHLGYVCEIQDAPIIGPDWTFPTDRYADRTNTWYEGKLTYYALENLFKSIRDHNDVRVPYLTKEQIVEEGWILTDIIDVYKKGDYTFEFSHWLNNISSICIMRLGETPYPKYIGTCKSINEFRTIMKLLNIK